LKNRFSLTDRDCKVAIAGGGGDKQPASFTSIPQFDLNVGGNIGVGKGSDDLINLLLIKSTLTFK
jgi:hypothetical protein